MNNIAKKIRNFFLFHYHNKRSWSFPQNMAHSTAYKIIKGKYEPEVKESIENILSEGSIFVDIGAGIGVMSKFSAELVGTNGYVFSAEADRSNFVSLIENTKSFDNIIPIYSGISNDKSIKELNISNHSACHSLKDTKNLLSGKKSKVTSLTIDFIFENYIKEKIKLLKIDVEGAEIEVLNGASRTIDKDFVQNIIIEYCPGVLKNTKYEVEDFYNIISGKFDIYVLENKHKLDKNGSIDNMNDFEELTNNIESIGGKENCNLLCVLK